MDVLIAAAARALAAGDSLAALKRVALRNDAPALALRGIAMAQLGDLVRAKALLRKAARAFGPKHAVAQARCIVAGRDCARLARLELARQGARHGARQGAGDARATRRPRERSACAPSRGPAPSIASMRPTARWRRSMPRPCRRHCAQPMSARSRTGRSVARGCFAGHAARSRLSGEGRRRIASRAIARRSRAASLQAQIPCRRERDDERLCACATSRPHARRARAAGRR
jgi:hypothetical protein